jgi:hypothetical protein
MASPIRHVRRALAGRALGTALLLVAAAVAGAQEGGLVARYPDPTKVGADYADDAERYAALMVLSDDFRAKTKGARVPGAYAKSEAYFRGFSAVTEKYMGMKTDAPERLAYAERADRLSRDAEFRRAVLERYQVADLEPAPPAPADPAQPALPESRALWTRPQSADLTDEMFEAACLRALPFALAGLAAMTLASRVLVARSVASPSGTVRPLPPPPGVPSLPESLRVVRLPGVAYPVESSSGVVIDKETTVETTVSTTTTAGQAYAVGNQVHTTPGQTHTSVSSVQKDVIWVRTSDGREQPWTFVGGAFKARRGQILSVIDRPLPDGTSDRLFAYNHATGQFESFPGVGRANAPSGKAAWWTSWAIGTVGFGAAGGVLVRLAAEIKHTPVEWETAAIVGAFTSTVVSMLVVWWMKAGVQGRRDARFAAEYPAAFRRFLEQSTPPLTSALAER